MSAVGGVAAHVIAGPREEPFLGALLETLVGAADALIVNDNSTGDSPHEKTLANSWFARNGRLLVDRTPFTDFSNARNACLRVHRANNAGDWAVFVDCDEVHGEPVRRIARNLGAVPCGIDFVDGYTWHFFQSFRWYTSIERRMAFFRVRSEAKWEGPVHEHLTGLSGGRLALPYVYAHYGHVMSARQHAEKGRQYSSLGQKGAIVESAALDRIDVREYFSAIWPTVLRFTGEHPSAARQMIQTLARERRKQFALTDEIVAEVQPAAIRARNFFMKLNYEQRWRSRALDPLARRLLSA